MDYDCPEEFCFQTPTFSVGQGPPSGQPGAHSLPCPVSEVMGTETLGHRAAAQAHRCVLSARGPAACVAQDSADCT